MKINSKFTAASALLGLSIMLAGCSGDPNYEEKSENVSGNDIVILEYQNGQLAYAGIAEGGFVMRDTNVKFFDKCNGNAEILLYSPHIKVMQTASSEPIPCDSLPQVQIPSYKF